MGIRPYGEVRIIHTEFIYTAWVNVTPLPHPATMVRSVGQYFSTLSSAFTVLINGRGITVHALGAQFGCAPAPCFFLCEL